METGIVTAGTPLTAAMVREQVNLIQEVMKDVMQEGQHYGKVPGCGDKPTLLKPGAEKLSMTFRLRPIMDNDRDIRIEQLPNGHREVFVYCHVFNMDGVELATGVGSCSTMESKYRYRGGEKIPTGDPVPAAYWNLKKEGKRDEMLSAIGGVGRGVAKIDAIWQICEIGEKMENPDIADTYNTVLKMAKKRAYVDGILSATAASDIFTQDIEDLPDTASKEVKETATETTQKRHDSSEPIKMISKYGGDCAICGEKIKKGEEIYYSPKNKHAAHVKCFTQQAEEAKTDTNTTDDTEWLEKGAQNG